MGQLHKSAMVEGGSWRATAPHVKGHAGFRLNALVSTLANASWGKLAQEFVEVECAPRVRQGKSRTVSPNREETVHGPTTKQH